ncbi:MAG: hypothetical protein AAGF81_10315 [Pseudomonadota bacterium]
MPEQTVHRRKVFYISGFDPKGPSHHHALYAKEAAKQTPLNGLAISVGQSSRKDRVTTSWPLSGRMEAISIETDYAALRWDDIMRQRMRMPRLAFARSVLRTYWHFVRTGALWRILKTSYPPFLAGIYPVVLLCALTMVAVCAGISAYVIVPYPAALPAGAGAFFLTLYLGRWLERRMPVFWPLHIFAFAADHMAGRAPQMDERIARFADEIACCAASSTDDEILIASHSNGTVIAVLALAAALKTDPELGKRGPAISFLTLGQSIPMCSFLPEAKALRQALMSLSENKDIAWIDISAPRDAACFALTDPLTASGLEHANPAAPSPKLLSLPIGDVFTPDTFHSALRRRWLRLHFQYLMATERPTPFDYFLITAGPLTLAERFASFASRDGYAKFRLFSSGSAT